MMMTFHPWRDCWRKSLNACVARVLLVVVFGVFAGERWSVTGQTATASPPIVVAHHDFGTTPLLKVFVHAFPWRNDTPSEIRISTVTTSCDCVQVADFPKSIAPGGEARITVLVTPKTAGPVEWLVYAEIEGGNAIHLFSLVGVVETDGAGIGTTPSPCFVEARDLLSNPGPTTSTVFVDIRDSDRFQLARIPGALNQRPYTVKTKEFLKAKNLVLVNDGHEDETLLQLCRQLEALQFRSVRILRGGVQAWRLAGGPLEGEQVAAVGWKELKPSQFQIGRGDPGWLVVNIHTDITPSPLANTSASVDLTFDPARFSQDLRSAVSKYPATKRVLLLTFRGEENAALDAALADFNAVPVFSLAGGAEAYTQYIAQQLAMQNRRQITLSSGDRGATRFNQASGSAGRPGSCCGGKR